MGGKKSPWIDEEKVGKKKTRKENAMPPTRIECVPSQTLPIQEQNQKEEKENQEETKFVVK